MIKSPKIMGLDPPDFPPENLLIVFWKVSKDVFENFVEKRFVPMEDFPERKFYPNEYVFLENENSSAYTEVSSEVPLMSLSFIF